MERTAVLGNRPGDEARTDGIEVLHILKRLDIGGVENWLLNLARSAPDNIKLTVASSEPRGGVLEPDFVSAGVTLVTLPSHTNPWRYGRGLWRILKADAKFRAVHSHLGFLGGLITAVARVAGVPIRVAQIHTAGAPGGKPRNRWYRAYMASARLMLRTTATNVLGCSEGALHYLTGDSFRSDSRCQIMHNGIDLEQYAGLAETRGTEKEPGRRGLIRGLTICHIGRFIPEKNHHFLIDVADELAGMEVQFSILLRGDGPEQPSVAKAIAERGLLNKFSFVGRTDIPAFLAQTADVLVLPSSREGVPLVVTEAQAAGVPCVVSEAVPGEAIVNANLVQIVPLSWGPTAWAEAILEAACRADPSTTPVRLMRESSFSMESNWKYLEQMYTSGR
jgi:glycosyltransferase involved in cell wall biosynthesis